MNPSPSRPSDEPDDVQPFRGTAAPARRTSDGWLISGDGSGKKVWEDSGSEGYETGFYFYRSFDSVCVSSQTGCNVGCRFCLTARSPRSRNLSVEEIAAQVRAVAAFRRDGVPLRVSFQGMGEPLDNFAAVQPAIEALYAEGSADSVGISTVGDLQIMDEMTFAAGPVKLQLSLHATRDNLRARLIPNSPAGTIVELLTALDGYARRTGAETVVNYLLLDGVNDALTDAAELAGLLEAHAPRSRLKLSRFNEHDLLAFTGSSPAHVDSFADVLRDAGIDVYMFESLGADVLGGCGQFNPRLDPAQR